ncbi:DNA-directed RNA polymerase II subunit RPB1, putative [Plasmodium relictum]|uniref:DNA-directed RNA polymerase subunit n=1 Tax=Plasmodium relictum TaxID=85471 RepID=A0A1J1H847_PLARL|nr:DNA-directed RNA polymerase II subunit RPB1, putative [Plasmodium relictum]CRG99773.1 DNA-directed RNA polymerase II subunit RPB1, putative [Plasmodium relictum]
MTIDLNVPYSACDLKRVKRLELGVLDPEIIKKISVCEIVNVDIYKDGLPREGGLNDIRMGTIDYKTLCGTCNMNVKYCPGHFGHIQLAKPMYHYGFMNVVLNVLRCVCYHCGRLLCNMNNSKVKYIEKIKVNSLRLKKLSELCSSIKVCDHSAHEDSLNINDSSIDNFYNNDLSNLNVNQQMLLNPNSYSNIFEMVSKEDVDCGCVQPKYTREGPNMFIQFLHSSEEDIDESKRKLSAEEALEILKKIRKEEMDILGFNSDRCIPSSLILTYIPIPPPCARPYVQYGNQRSEDDLTLKLLDIVKTNIQLKRQTDRGAKSHVLQDLCSLLQFHITTLFDNDIPGMPIATTRSKKPIKAIRTRLKGKEGRLRGNLMGKRVDFSARTVITGDPNLDIDYIGVPKSVAMTLTFCETVTPLNYEDLKRRVERGPYEWPGAKYIIRDNGTKYDLRHVRKNSEKELEYGYKVERHMTDEDYILFNRQPSLHKMSIMGHKAKILPYSTFRLNLAVTSPYNADFDGDEMNLHLAQSHETRSEIKHLMIVQKQIVSPQGNKPVMGIVQDSLLAIRKFTRRDNFLCKEEVMSLLIWIPYWNHVIPTPAIIKPKALWTGKQIFSMLLQFDDMNKNSDLLNNKMGDNNLKSEEEVKRNGITKIGNNQPNSPCSIVDNVNHVSNTFNSNVKNSVNSNDNFNSFRNLNMVKINLIRDSSTSCKDDNPYCSVNDGKVIIKNNELLSGIICKRTVGSSSGSLIHILWHEMGPDKTKDFISALQKVTNNWLEYIGFTVSCSDIIASNKILDKVKEILNKSKKEVTKLVKKAQRGELECQPGKSLYESFETRVNNELNCAREMAGKVASESLDERNNIFSMVASGSKGSIINISQIISCVGQQNVEGKRIPFGFNQRSLPHFIKFDYGPESRGFVSNSYLSGLSPQEVFFHAMGGREGIIDTACKTSETGYIQRRLIKAMEDVMVQYDRTVRNSYGDIIQFLYGEDGMAGEYIEDQIIDLMKLDNKEINKLYKYNFDEEFYGKDFYLCKSEEGKASYIDYNKQNILNQEFEELYKCKNYLCKEIFPDGDIRQHLPINMNRLIEYAKSQFPFIPLINSKSKNRYSERIQSKIKIKKKKKKKKNEANNDEQKNDLYYDGINNLHNNALDNYNNELLSEIKKEYENNDLSNIIKCQKSYNEIKPFNEEANNEIETDGNEDEEDDNDDDSYYYSDSSFQGNKKHFENTLKNYEQEDSSMVNPIDIVHKVNNFLEKLVIIKQINSNDTLSLEAQNNATILLKAHLRTYLNSKLLTQTHKISLKGIDWLLQEIEKNFYKSLCHPGECVGALAAQSIGEPATQMTLNTFHFAGVGSKNVTLGVPRLKELINIVKNVKTPSTTIYLDDLVSNDQQKAKDILTKLEYTTLRQLTSHAQIIYDPCTTTTILEEDKSWVNEFYEFPDEDDTQYTLGEWVLRIQLTNIHVNEKKLTMKEIVYIIYSVFSSDELDIIYTDDNSEDLILRIRVKYLNGEYNFINDDDDDDNGDEEEDDYNNIANSFKTKKNTSSDMNNNLNEKNDDNLSVNSNQSQKNNNSNESKIRNNNKKAGENDYKNYNEDDSLFGNNTKNNNDNSTNSKSMFNNYENMKESGNQDDIYNKSTSKLMEDDAQMKNRNKNNNPLLSKEDTEDTFLKKLMEQCLSTLKLRGIENITKVYMREEAKINYDVENGKFVRSSHWVLDTDGCNLENIFCAPLVDYKKTISNDIVEIFEVLGIEAVRRALLKELRTVISFDSSYVNYRHLSILCDVMTQKGYLMSITRHGINRVDKGPLIKCSFEETVEILLEAAAFAQVDHLKGITENIMLGQLCKIGTGAFDIIIDNQKLNDANQNLETIQDITSAGFTTPDTYHGITPDGLQSPVPINTLNSPLPFSPTYNSNLLSPTAPIDNVNSILSPQCLQNYPDNIMSPSKNDFNNLDTLKLGGKFSPTQSPKSPTSIVHSPFSPFDHHNQQPIDPNQLFSPKSNLMNYNVFSPKANMNNIQSPVLYSPNPMLDIFSPKPQMQSNIYSPSYSPTSPSYNADNVYYSPTSPKNQMDDIKSNIKYNVMSPVYSVTSPKYSPMSPQYSPTSPVANNPGSPHYSPYSITSPKFSPTSPAYSISSPVYDKSAVMNNQPLSPAYIIQSPVQVKQNIQDAHIFSPIQQSNKNETQNDDPFSPIPYNIEEDEMQEMKED